MYFLHFKIYNEIEELYIKESNMFDKKYIFVILHKKQKTCVSVDTR